MTKILKVRVGGPLADRLMIAAESERVPASELVRRALALLLAAEPVAAGPLGGPSGRPSAPSPLPSSPPTPPLIPLSLLSPAPPGEPQDAAAEAGGGDGGAVADLAEDAALVFPCIRDSKTNRLSWELTRAQLAAWEEIFADMDVLAEARLARGWLQARGLRKTWRGMPRFLFGWLSRGQNSGRYQRRAPGRKSAGAAQPTLLETYGYASWEEWEATLRRHFQAEVLAQELGRLHSLRLRWEAGGA